MEPGLLATNMNDRITPGSGTWSTGQYHDRITAGGTWSIGHNHERENNSWKWHVYGLLATTTKDRIMPGSGPGLLATTERQLVYTWHKHYHTYAILSLFVHCNFCFPLKWECSCLNGWGHCMCIYMHVWRLMCNRCVHVKDPLAVQESCPGKIL